MSLLNTADNLYLGSSAADCAFLDGTKVWASLEQRQAAATAAANADIAAGGVPFFGAIGNGTDILWQGSFGPGAPGIDDAMSIASASKMLYGAYCDEVVMLDSSDWPGLTMSDGHHSMNGPCLQNKDQTVGQCLLMNNDSGLPYDHYTAADDGFFWYNSAPFQHHATNRVGLGLVTNNRSQLSQAYRSVLGFNNNFAFGQPQIATGIATNASNYIGFLQKIVSKQLKYWARLGTLLVPASMANGAHFSPAPPDSDWHYGPTHWREDDGTFSSPGKYGFYPFITRDLRLWGVIARYDASQPGGEIGLVSVATGTSIRNAFLTGTFTF